jgi:ubiquinone/menaquinone biosynthesis C-methylase UbiE
MTQRVDYNRIAHRYDDEALRKRPADPKLIEFCRARGAADGGGVKMLDVGCGTGIQLVANLAQLPRLRATGVDLHEEMLVVARSKTNEIDWVQADAGALPFADGEFDYVGAQLCFHHFRDKPRALSEAVRVLKPGGRLVMVNLSPWRMRDWDVYRYFPEAFARDELDSWADDELRSELERAGLAVSVVEPNHIRREVDLAERLAFYRERYSPSQLVAISDEAFDAGLARLQRDITAAGGAPVRVGTHICLLTLVAEKPRRR